MLEYIVLGQIPGTSIYLSFSEIMKIIAIISIITVGGYFLMPAKTSKKQNPDEIAAIAL